MTEAIRPERPPERILVATDGGSRSDRALDRAAQLARQWNAHLIIVHAMEAAMLNIAGIAEPLPSWRRPPDPVQVMERQIRRDLREPVGRLSIHIEIGDPVPVILQVAEQQKCDFIVLGTAREDLPGPGRLFAGSTVEQLVRKAPVSLLVVKSRPDGPYRHVLVGTDFTDESRAGLVFAATAFPDSQLTALHACEMAYRALRFDNPLSTEFAAMERATMQEFIRNSGLPEDVRDRIRTVIEHGPADLMLSHYADEKHADLTVIGAYGRGRLFHLLIGGNAPRIMDSVHGDVLLVRAKRGTAAPAA